MIGVVGVRKKAEYWLPLPVATESMVGGDEGGTFRLLDARGGERDRGRDVGESGVGVVEPGPSMPVDKDVDDVQPMAMLTHAQKGGGRGWWGRFG